LPENIRIKIYKMSEIYMAFARKIIKMANFLMIFARTMPEFYMIIALKKFF